MGKKIISKEKYRGNIKMKKLSKELSELKIIQKGCSDCKSCYFNRHGENRYIYKCYIKRVLAENGTHDISPREFLKGKLYVEPE
jgi:hypothetical protein